jgi:hypothetical protein
MALQDVAYLVFFMSVMVNLMLFAFGIIDENASVFAYLNDSQREQLIQNRGSPIDTANITDETVLDSTTSSGTTGTGNSFIPFFDGILGIATTILKVILLYPTWIIQAMILANVDPVFLIVFGVPLIILQYFAELFFLLSLTNAFSVLR